MICNDKNSPDISALLCDKTKHAHLIGIGGVSMFSLAETLIDAGITVTGSDSRRSSAIDKLEKSGIKITIGHNAKSVDGADYIIRTAAVHNDNPEIAAAIDACIPVFERAEAWGAVMQKYKNAICVAGTHGKTTTTSMITHIALAADSDPTVMIGGTLPVLEGGHRVGGGDTIILEACEYCNSFLSFFPSVAVILNVDADHLDFFKDLDDVKHSFRHFALRVDEKDGVVVVNADDKNARDCTSGIDRRIITFGIDNPADVTAKKIGTHMGLPEFDIYYLGKKFAHINLLVPGRHNILNALAAAAACIACGMDGVAVETGLSTFSGVARRFEYKGQVNGAVIYDDYAHHPNEIKALFDSVFEMGYQRVICAFQPHTFTRTAAFFDDFVRELSRPDVLVLADIFAAREKNTVGITSADLAKRIEGSYLIPDFNDMADFLKTVSRPGDVIITVGAGELNLVSEKIAEPKIIGAPKKPRRDPFDRGVSHDGLHDITDIKILICYLIKAVGGRLEKSLLFEIVQSDGMASYWKLSEALSELISQNAVSEDLSGEDACYTLCETGILTADELEIKIPLTLRERAVRDARRITLRAKAKRENKIKIEKTKDGYQVVLSFMDGEKCMLTLALYAPDSLSADYLKQRFLDDPAALYKSVMQYFAK